MSIYLSRLARRDLGQALTEEEIEARMFDPQFEALHMLRREAVAFTPSQRLEGARMTQLFDGGVAVINVTGPIYRHAASAPSGATSTAQIASDIELTTRDPKVKSRIIAFDTPGGEATGMDEVAQRIFSSRGVKPIEAYVEGLGASAGYYLASAASKITASRLSMTGSIGVVVGMQVPAGTTAEGQQVYEDSKGHVVMEFVSSQSPLKRANITTKEGRKYYQQLVDESADVFVGDVARFRNLKAEDVPAQYGDGGLSVAGTAQTRGLIDAIGSFEQVLERMQSAGSLTPNPVSVSVPEGFGADGGDDMAKGMIERIRAAVGGGNASPTTPELVAQPTKTRADLLAEIAEERPTIEEPLEAKAIAYAMGLVTGSRIPPVAQVHVAGQMLTAMADDAMYGGTVVFAGPKGEEVEGTRTDQIKAMYDAWPAHTLATKRVESVVKGEVVPMVLKETAGVKANSDPDDHGVETLTEDELQALTPAGRRVLEERKAQTNGNRR